MFGFERKMILKIAQNSSRAKKAVPSVIGADTKIKGDIWGSNVLHINGKIDGNIAANAVIIGAKGYIMGDIKAQKISVYGTVNGVIDTEELFVANNARLVGNAYYSKISMEPGAYIEGNCMPRSKAAPAADAPESKIAEAGKTA